jgi:hypothetical protein
MLENQRCPLVPPPYAALMRRLPDPSGLDCWEGPYPTAIPVNRVFTKKKAPTFSRVPTQRRAT